jgi:DNA-directed RNA polymerase alpha subunit
MSDDGYRENERKTIRERPESDDSETDSYQSDEPIKEAELYVTSIANLRRREMHGISSYLDMSNKDMNKRKNVDIQEKEENLATLKAMQKHRGEGCKTRESKKKCVLC